MEWYWVAAIVMTVVILVMAAVIYWDNHKVIDLTYVDLTNQPVEDD